MVAFTVTIAAACGTHFEANWASLLTLKEECVDTFRMLLAYSVSDVIVDLCLLIVPIPLVSDSFVSGSMSPGAQHSMH